MTQPSAPTVARPSRAPIAILGVPFDNVTTAETMEIIADMIASGRPHYAATANVDFIVQALEDVELRRILFDAHLVLADGQPIVWASRWLGNPLPERVTGSGLVPLLLERAESAGWKVFFLGGTQESVATAAARTLEKHPRLQLVGAYSPPFKPLLEMDHEDLLRRIRQARPDILLVAFGCPKQEKWIRMHLESAGVPFSVGVGATIDFLAGTFKRAPVWMQRTGTEWVFRMLQEPRRLAKRYGKDLRVFGTAILRQWWNMKRRTKAPPTGATPSPARPADITVIPMPSRLDASSAAAGRLAWEERVSTGRVVLNLAETTFADSTGIGVLIRLRKLAREKGHGFAVAGMGPQIASAIQLMKLQDFIPSEPTVERACTRVVEAAAVSEIVGTNGSERLEFKWQGEITAVTAGETRASTLGATEHLRKGARVTVDLSSVAFVDSSGIGMMIGLKRLFWQRGVRVVFRSPTSVVREVLRMTKIETFLLDDTQ